ncbi:rhodanese-like domain-containing protein [Kaustia mangrovi]|uniref:Rhodanese-like domain-containing protein n=1 Tax=Kaustia mangrovi TaxID=2593653 RepID=A0A7S8C7V5_9HYPH|nr:rhodanese-like domain-containing protein [Kaustia mangrovi]QPC45002.1 rhodanese-like domain-containing protein [Kaustia mangrovi]
MAQTISVGIKQLIEEGRKEIQEVTADEAMELAKRDDVVIVDIRDVRELWREGRIPGTFHVPRGMLEFWIDPASPYHKPKFAEDKTFIFHCASGMRSVLATQVAARMGLKPVYNLKGGFGGWKEAGGPVEAVEKK